MTVDLIEIQKEVNEWAVRNFGPRDGWQPLLGVVEEVGELAHAHLKNAQRIRTNEDHRTAKFDAVGDILIYLIDYCNREGIWIDEALHRTWSQVKQRDWKANPHDGKANEALAREWAEERA